MINPYEELYRNSVQKVSITTTVKQAELMAIQMSFMYNAFGVALKDLVSLLGSLYTVQQQQQKALKSTQNQTESHSSAQKSSHHTENHHKCESQFLSNSISNRPDQQFNFDKYKLDLKDENKYTFNRDNYNPEGKTKATKTNNTMDTYGATKQKPTTRIEIVRGKKEREILNGYSCTMCEKFYRALGEEYLDSRGNDRLCNDCSRHRSNLPPTNFYCDFSQQFGFDD